MVVNCAQHHQSMLRSPSVLLIPFAHLKDEQSASGCYARERETPYQGYK